MHPLAKCDAAADNADFHRTSSLGLAEHAAQTGVRPFVRTRPHDEVGPKA